MKQTIVILFILSIFLGPGACKKSTAQNDAGDMKTTEDVASDSIADTPGKDTTAQVKQEIQTGVENLGQGNIDAAKDHFETAYDSDNSSAQAAFGLALTKLILLVEDPVSKDILAYLGRDPMSADMIFGPNGMFAKLSSGVTCDDNKAFLRQNLPWHYLPSFAEFFDGMPADAKGDVVVTKLLLLLPKFEEIIALLKVAEKDTAFNMILPGSMISITGDLQVGRPELYLLEGSLHVAKGAILMGSAYDWSYSLQSDFGSSKSTEQKVAIANKKFLYLKSGITSLDDARTSFEAGIDALVSGIDGAILIHDTDNQMPVAWSQIDKTELSTLKTLLIAFKDSLRNSTVIPYLNPTTTLNLSGFFDAPVDAKNIEYEPWDWDPINYQSVLVEAFFEALVKAKFTPDIYEDYSAKYWMPRWFEWKNFKPLFADLMARLNAAHPHCKW